MKRLLIATALVASLGACTTHASKLTPEQAKLATQLETAPTGSVLIFKEDKAMHVRPGFGIVCKPTKDYKLRLAIIGYTSFGCGAQYVESARAAVWFYNVTEIVTPDNPKYQGLVERQTMYLAGTDVVPQ